MKLIGGKLKVKELKKFLEESYNDPAPVDIMGYILDEKLSKKSIFDKQMTARVYVNINEKKVIITHRGTGMEMYGSDWLNNMVYASSTAAYKLTPRFTRAKLVQDNAIKKYSGYEINSIGHSQGGLIVHLLNSPEIKNSIGFNPASKNEMLDKNEYIIRSSGDAVSALSVPNKMMNETLYPGWTKRHLIEIKSESGPVAEHSPAILDRLDPEMLIGKGISKLKGYIINPIMLGGCSCQKENILTGGAFKNKKSFQVLAQKILSLLDESDIDEFCSLQQDGTIHGGGIATDANFKAYQLKIIIEEILIKNPGLRIIYKSKNKTELIKILDQLEKDKLLDGFDFQSLPQKNPKSASIGDVLKRFGKKKLTNEEQEAFIQEFENSPIYSNIYEGVLADERTGQKIKPLKHQKDFIQQFAMSNLRGAIAFHGVGSGKTLTAVISSYYFLKLYPDRKVIVISPSALLFNFLQGMIQYGLETRDTRYQFFTYDKYIRNPVDTTGALVIVDEAHNFRTEIQKSTQIDTNGKLFEYVKTNKRGYKISETATRKCFKVILLTGTAFVNKIYDVENLLAMVDNREPLSEQSFTDAITNPLNLSSYFDYKISHFERGADENFPDRRDINHPLYMTEAQEKEYNKIKREGPPDHIRKQFRLEPREPGGSPNSFYSAEQFASNYIIGEDGMNPKVKYILNLIIDNPTQKFIIYSSFLNTGIFNLVGHLEEKKIPNTKPVFITGRETSDQKDESKRLFNNYVVPNTTANYTDPNNEYRLLFITKAGSEGVDTRNCQNIILFDELWNDATAEQVIARAIRYKSHEEFINVKERYVNVIRVFFLKEDGRALYDLLQEENPDYSKIDEHIRETKFINKNIEKGLSKNTIKALPNFNLEEFKAIPEKFPKAEMYDIGGQQKRRDKIRKFELDYLKQVETDFKNGKNGFKTKFTKQENKDNYLKRYTTIHTSYGKKNLHRPLPYLQDVEKTDYFDKSEYLKALQIGQEDVYLIQVQQTIETQGRQQVLSPDFLSGIQRDEELSTPSVDMFKYILSKTKEERIKYFIENFGNKIALYEKYESKYRNKIIKYAKETNQELTGKLEMKLMKEIVAEEKETVSDILWTDIQKNKIEEYNKRTKEEKLQQFYTPPEVSYSLIDEVFKNIKNMDNMTILEPTAGQGGLLIPFCKPKNRKLIDYNKTNNFDITLVEIDPDNRKYLENLKNKGGTFLKLEKEGNFLKYDTSNRFNIIVSNPPFHLRKEEHQGLVKDVMDIDFLLKCVTLLKIGGCMGAIIGKKSGKDRRVNDMRQAGTVEIMDMGKKRFGTILTPVIFLIFVKENEDYDEEFRTHITNLLIEPSNIPAYLEQPVEVFEDPVIEEPIKETVEEVSNKLQQLLYKTPFDK